MNEKKNIGGLFDRIASHYDSLNHLFSLNIDKRWRRQAVASINHKGDKCLDVAIGTADLAIEIIRQDKAQTVQGIDLSEGMMNIGKEKVEKKGIAERIDFMLASALDMPFADECFDIVTCSYGVRNFADLDKGLQEMHRVLKQGGELRILEFSYPENKFIAWVYDIYFTHIMPFVGRLLSRDKTAYTYFNHSVKNFVWGKEMCGHLRQAGFHNVTYQPQTFGISTLYKSKK